jgi:peptide chain release factor 1
MYQQNLIKMEKKDLKISYTRGSGPGGQHKNKVETCVTVTHLPTGLSERCQDTRSKNRNLKIALQRLESKINQQKIDEQKKLKCEQRLEKIKNPKRIRTYNFITKKVVDHRTKKIADLEKVMNGEITLLK